MGTIPKPRQVTVTDEQYGHKVLTALQDQFELDYSDPRYNKVVEIVGRLTKAAKADQDPWHVYLFKAPGVKNAAATRGNHVFVWSGMLDATNSNGELATILAHEISHVLAGHTDPDPNEEIKKLLISLGAAAAEIAINYGTSGSGANINLGQLGGAVTQQIGAGVILNPYSRKLETEADTVGLMIMASAKYNPQEAINFWTRASNDPDFSSSAEFFSTHPLATKRLTNLQNALPVAMEFYSGKRTVENSQQFIDTKIPKPPIDPKTKSSNLTSNTSSNASSETWRVVEEKAVIRSSASESGKPIGELTKDALIQVVGRQNVWLKISSPEIGYIKGVNCEPVE